MKALVKKERKPGLWLENVPTPTYGDNDVLIRVKKSAICGTDVHIYKWDAWSQSRIPTPMVLGHEFMGEVAAFGKNVKGIALGERVTAEGHITCGVCPNCQKNLRHLCSNSKGIGIDRPGSFAEYLAVPAENIFKLPSSVPDDFAAIFDPFGNAVHTALSFPLKGEDVLITGAGPIGAMAAAIARHEGARRVVITDINPYRLELAKQMGATDLIDVSRVSLQEATKALGIPHGYTVGLEMSGAPRGFEDMLKNMQHGGKVALLGLIPAGTPIDWNIVIFHMLTLKGIYGREIFGTWHKMVALLEEGLTLAPIITHHYPIDDYEKGFEAMLSGQAGKVILNWEHA